MQRHTPLCDLELRAPPAPSTGEDLELLIQFKN